MYFKEIDISKIKPLPEGQRPALPELTNEEYREMKENIQKYGILQNLVVTEERSNGKISAYILQAGYTRFQIAGELEMETVPCNVEDDEFSLALRCSTDAFRRNLSSRDRRELIKYLGYAEEGDGTGKHRKYSTDSPEVQKLKQEIEENSKKIKAMEAELEESNRIALENIDGLKEQIEASKKQEVNMTETLKSVRTLLKTEQENFKRFKADLKEKKFVGRMTIRRRGKSRRGSRKASRTRKNRSSVRRRFWKQRGRKARNLRRNCKGRRAGSKASTPTRTQ